MTVNVWRNLWTRLNIRENHGDNREHMWELVDVKEQPWTYVRISRCQRTSAMHLRGSTKSPVWARTSLWLSMCIVTGMSTRRWYSIGDNSLITAWHILPEGANTYTHTHAGSSWHPASHLCGTGPHGDDRWRGQVIKNGSLILIKGVYHLHDSVTKIWSTVFYFLFFKGQKSNFTV